jgi:pimeloyl-ACP methyl ester carboxylesterase
MANANQTVHLLAETLPLTISDQGRGRTFLILHGGAGPTSVSDLAEALADNGRAIVPTHPGFAGQPRPEWCRRVDDLVLVYLTLLERVDARDVVLVGNSFGGWIAAEMALRHSPRVAGLVLLCAAGIDAGPGGQAIVNPATLPPSDRAAFAFHDPKQFAVVPSTEDGLAMMAANQRAMLSYSGEAFMHDPTLRARLAGIAVPSMVIWGESDRIVNVEYGRRYADSIPGARFEVIAEAGHFPHIEKLERVLTLIGDLPGYRRAA